MVVGRRPDLIPSFHGSSQIRSVRSKWPKSAWHICQSRRFIVFFWVATIEPWSFLLISPKNRASVVSSPKNPHILTQAPVDFQIYAHYSTHSSWTKGLLLVDQSGHQGYGSRALELTSEDCRCGLGSWKNSWNFPLKMDGLPKVTNLMALIVSICSRCPVNLSDWFGLTDWLAFVASKMRYFCGNNSVSPKWFAPGSCKLLGCFW